MSVLARVKPNLAVAMICLMTAPAAAHTAARGFTQLLPTTAITIAGAAAVAVSFAALSVLPDRWFQRGTTSHPASPEVTRASTIASLISAVVFACLIYSGFAGSTDPLANPLPLMVWTGWWVIILVLHPVFGNLWRWINPFTGPSALIRSVTGDGPRDLPRPVGSAVSFVTLAAFVWWQLVSVTPEDPQRLAVILLCYAALAITGGAVFGGSWFERADPFWQLSQWLGSLSPLSRVAETPIRAEQLLLLPIFLGALSFDGLASSFTWLDMIGVNPLDFQGRGSVKMANTIGLFVFIASLAAAICASAAIGWLWAGRPHPMVPILARLTIAMLPIAIALHFAHFLTDVLVNGQYLLLALNDPLHTGWDIAGISHWHVTTSFLNTKQGVTTIYTLQAFAVVLGHVASVIMAHGAIRRLGLTRAQSVRLELPAAALMIAYTAFSLWTLSTPSIA